MNFEDKLIEFTETIEDKKQYIDTEETTKIALINPLLRLMGYDTTNPAEVRAEYTADVGSKKGEKIDLAIFNNDTPLMFIECKIVDTPLKKEHYNQLYRYFTMTDVKIGILTNGVNYKFFTDSKEPNKMDDTPFLDIDLNNLSKKDIKYLEKFTKGNFNIDHIINEANDLVYINEVKECLMNELTNPSDDFVKVIGKQVYDGPFTSKKRDKFRGIIIKVYNDVINDSVDKKLKEFLKQHESETLEEESINEEEIQEEVLYLEEDHFKDKSNIVLELYELLKKKIDYEFNNVEINVLKQYIAFKIDNKNIISLIPRNNGLQIIIGMKIGTLNDPSKKTEDMSEKGHWGTGDYRMYVNSIDDLDYLMFLFKQSYENKV